MLVTREPRRVPRVKSGQPRPHLRRRPSFIAHFRFSHRASSVACAAWLHKHVVCPRYPSKFIVASQISGWTRSFVHSFIHFVSQSRVSHVSSSFAPLYILHISLPPSV